MMITDTSRTAEWTTRDELSFLTELGTFSEVSYKLQQVDLLRGYLDAARERERWDSVNRKEVMEFAKKRLARITKSHHVGPGEA